MAVITRSHRGSASGGNRAAPMGDGRPAGVAVGDVFLVPLPDGRAGLCRVLQTRLDPPSVVVATSAWIGRAADAASAVKADSAAREILRLTHHGWRGSPHVFWTVMPLPERFVRVGTLAPSKSDLALPSKQGAWESCPLQVNAQWEWGHDREAVKARDAAAAKAQRRADEEERIAALERQALTRKKARSARPVDCARAERALRALARRRWFASWRGHVAPDLIDGSRAIMASLVASALARAGARAANRRALVAATRALNRLDERHHHPFGTLEAESLHEALMAFGAACQLDAEDCEMAIDDVRDW